MGGHRRISTELFLRHAERRKPRAKVEALLELDLDAFRGKQLSERQYAELWGWSREKVRKLLAEYRAALADLGAVDGGISHPTSDRTTDRPEAGPATDHENEESARTYQAAPTTDRPRTGPDTGPRPDHILEPESEPEGRGAPPNRPRAVGKEEEQKRRARVQVQRALMRLGPLAADESEAAEARLWTLQRMFLTCDQVANDVRLEGYLKGTAEIPAGLLAAACTRALGASERMFPPSIKAILDAGPAVAAAWRKRQRDGAAGGPRA